ncbi:LLM class F420-dependent oxidoreductase [Jonesia denitrificans]|uniref:Luciferase-like monooxygenase n=1 Tax=Jonesia denitrificans (strain ATCC 14870 / DSM 20603 / BCRC 15368 / CIP 55.134 / JCM 11481 / NBRC 15587 / NCTC 10816 / Prevot 55134) TaxID=471856 RepID=C7QZQ7_JONDD|nr:LLM class F420-dependent oxidoreductase [Jonesia denitrificans]ACV08063.1 Luciferase-like monooxygenase [Jonesia denitrificans DSM 20603]ASE08253.1 TIGR03560 family F420-dependent LLM class oxidoreductase [Jonesia denitrificans]QXB42853.1 LLM class F420-dependent oxidoreductase [Jonesia denitrificans]SQH20041.1 Phthiodiolone/phenolphthiodiolone dimycocerosates ketoreductase [Jonesia denitrificans]
MDFRIFTEPQQGATYDDLLAVAQATERLGFSAFFRSDHFLTMGGNGQPGPTDAWLTLAALARETSTIRLGTLVTSATFRHPGLLAIQVAQVDQMSQGRVDFGLGTGWYEAEHTAYGVPFPAHRFSLLEEQLAVITGLWETPDGQSFSYEGHHYTLTNSPALPKPTQERIPVIVGGGGPRRTPALAARYATEFNTPFIAFEELEGTFTRVREACTQAGRDPNELTYSSAFVACVGADDAEFERRATAIGRDPDELRRNGIAGTVPQAIAAVAKARDAGAQRIYLQILDLSDLDHLELIAREVVPAFA